MKNQKRKRLDRVRYLLCLPLVALMIAVGTTTTLKANVLPVQEEETDAQCESVKTNIPENIQYKVLKDLSGVLKYPESAQDNEQGRVVLGVMVDKKGKTISARVLEGA